MSIFNPFKKKTFKPARRSLHIPPRPSGIQPTEKRVCIIGAGATGLSTAKSLKEQNLHNITIFEQSDRLGGSWVYFEEQVPQSVVYKSLQMKSSKEISGFSDFPMPDDWPSYVNHALVNRYLQLYAEHFNVKQHIRYQHQVVNVEPVAGDSQQWEVTTRSLQTGEKKTQTFDYVVVGSGRLWHPKLPHFNGQESFPGEIVHSKFYKKPESFKGKRVVVVGLGNTAVDLVPELAEVADACWMSVRTHEFILPMRQENGRPIDHASRRLFRMIPLLGLPFLWDLIQKYDTKKVGLHDCSLKTLEATHGIISDNLYETLIAGKAAVKPEIKQINGSTVYFSDGSKTEADVILCCTGYWVHYPFLGDQLPVERNTVRLYKQVFPPHLPNLAVVGVCQSRGPNMPLIEIQGRWVAQIVAEKCGLPTAAEMTAEIEHRQQLHRQTYGRHEDSTQLANETLFVPYCQDIAKEFGAHVRWWRYLTFGKELLWGIPIPTAWRLDGPGSWPQAESHIKKIYRLVRVLPFDEEVQKEWREKALRFDREKTLSEV